MGARFFLGAAGVAGGYLVHRILTHHDVAKQILLSFVGVLLCALAGKFLGIGIARIRLAFLWRQLANLQAHARMPTHVSLHEVGR